jgi:TolA-binding protein
MPEEKTVEELQKELEQVRADKEVAEAKAAERDAASAETQAQLDALNEEIEALREKDLNADELQAKKLSELEARALAKEKEANEKSALAEQKSKEVATLSERIKIIQEYPDVPQEFIFGDNAEDMKKRAEKFRAHVKGIKPPEGNPPAPGMSLHDAPAPGAGNAPSGPKPVVDQLKDQEIEAKKKGDVDSLINAKLQEKAEYIKGNIKPTGETTEP